MMESLLDLPSDAITCIMTNWLHMKDIGKLDLAVRVNRHLCRRYASEIERAECVFSGTSDFRRYSPLYFNWIANRGIRVRRLELNIPVLHDGQIVSMINSQCNAVEELVISGLHEKIRVNSLSRCTRLSSLHLLDTHLGSDTLIDLFRCILVPSNLTDISFQSCTGVSSEALAMLSHNAKNLRKLLIDNCHLRSAGDDSCSNVESIKCGFRALQELNVSFCDGVDNAALVNLMLGCSRLTSLQLSYCPVTDEGLKRALGSRTTQLRSLCVESEHSALTSFSVAELLRRSPQLESLELECTGSYDTILRNVLDHCPRLARVDLHCRDGGSVSLSEAEMQVFCRKIDRQVDCRRFTTIEEAPALVVV